MSDTLFQYTSQTKITAILGIAILLMTAFMGITSNLLSITEYTISLASAFICLISSESVTTTIDTNSELLCIEKVSAFTLFRKKKLVVKREDIKAINKAGSNKKKNPFTKIYISYNKDNKVLSTPSLVVRDIFLQDDDGSVLFEKVVAWIVAGKTTGVSEQEQQVAV
jgi:hypothetical protein